MSRAHEDPVLEGGLPFLKLVDLARTALAKDMVHTAQSLGYTETTYSHGSVFATLPETGRRASDMAADVGITRQSMGEIIRSMVELGWLEMRPDPDDKRAKVVFYTAKGLENANAGFGHIVELEQLFITEFGEKDYMTARRVVARITEMIQERQ